MGEAVMAKKKAAPKTTAIAKREPAPDLAIDLSAKHLAAAVAFRDRAVLIVIGDKASDEGALQAILEGKRGRKETVSDWQVPKRKVAAVTTALRALEAKELEAWDAGLDVLEKRHVEYKRLDDERVAREAQAERERLEAIERKKRDADLKAQEKAADRLEAESANLSARELWFVTKVFDAGLNFADPNGSELRAMRRYCEESGYKDPAAAVDRLRVTPKIVQAITAKREAAAIREQAAALREEPITVAAPKIESNVARVAGARNTKHYSCGGVFDLAKFRAAYLAGDIPAEAMIPNPTFLNGMADQLKEKFEQAYPGARLKVDEGVAG